MYVCTYEDQVDNFQMPTSSFTLDRIMHVYINFH